MAGFKRGCPSYISDPSCEMTCVSESCHEMGPVVAAALADDGALESSRGLSLGPNAGLREARPRSPWRRFMQGTCHSFLSIYSGYAPYSCPIGVR